MHTVMRSLQSAACIALLLAAPLSCVAHVTSPSSTSLTIDIAGRGEHRVTLPDRKSGATLAECVFTFETSPDGGAKKAASAAAAAAELAKQAQASGRVDVATVAASFAGACISSNSDYWTYELCFNKHFKQFHGPDIYVLARDQATVSTNNGHSLAMGAGDMCMALQPPKPRAVKMNFACKKNAQVSRSILAGRA